MLLYQMMKLIYKALERKIIISSAINKWYLSEGFTIQLSGWIFTIKYKDKEATLEKDDNHLSKSYKEFHSLVKKFLDVTFPS